ncbi:hypothetical protein [Sediminibacter sp. Hel_I_10]|uniref:hypothetical protein n=1 Tax=Sediminibacter sp. Hel_I_10 TaxID=1392490 RepID=UPI0012DC0916|nr:hypothetical protein [Sediminibacter sp. Hel_I_10]
MTSTEIKLSRATQLWESINKKAEFYNKKWNKARTSDSIDKHYDTYKMYRAFEMRAYNLAFRIKIGGKFGEGREWFEQTAEQYKARRAERKKERRLAFESNYRIHLHFMQHSFHADYGTFSCDCCQGKFYHSPCDVYYGSKKIHSSCCGRCANHLLTSNRQEPVYS